MRIAYVFDTSVLVAAMRSKNGASRQLLLEVLAGHLDMLISIPLMLEYEEVLMRPEHLSPGEYDEIEVGNLLDAVGFRATRVLRSFRWRPQLRDPDDEMVLETAINGHADAIVTFNQRDFAEAAARFQCKVLSPSEALSIYRRQRDEKE